AWETLAIPNDVTPLTDEILAKAPPPEIFKIKTEKVKRETIVKKPNLLPFLPPKEEVVVVWDRKETRERAEIDPELHELRYAPKGAKLGTLTPPKAPKPGKSVYGKPIVPRQQGDGLFLLGAGIKRAKNELYAEWAGLLRIGDAWADITPLAKPVWNVEKGSDGITFFFRFEPGDSRFAVPKGKDILALAREKGAPEESLVDEAYLDGKIQQAVQSGEPAFYPVVRSQEAEARVDISADRLKATLFLRKGAAGGTPLRMQAIANAIRQSGVKGFNAEQVKADVNAFMRGNSLVLDAYVLAEGRESTRGKDKELKILSAFLPDPEKNAILEKLKTIPQWQLAVNRDRFIPLADVTNIARVEKGQKVVEVSAPAAGTPGVDVFGTVLPGLPGNDPDIKLYKGLHQQGQNIIADQSGILLVHDGERVFWGQAAEYRDAQVTVTVSADAMSADISLVKEAGSGVPLKPAMILEALKEAGVIKGLDKAAIENAYREAMTKGSSRAVAARGEVPVAGGGSSVKWLVDPNVSRALTVTDEGRADYKNQRHFVSVEAGHPVAELSREGDAGRNGYDVRGAVLAAEQGARETIGHDDSIKEVPSGEITRLVAATSGELSFKDNVLKIITLHTVKGDVGLATGDIKFSGEIHVSGRVSPGFKVMGSRDVLIGEGAESSLVSAGGRVVITGGVIGGGKGIIRARTTIEAAFAEQATLMAVEDITVRNGCILCNIKTNGRLILNGEKGRLVGGVCKARRGVDAASIGSEQGNRTEISFGQDYLIKDQIEVSEREIEKIRAHLLEADERIKAAAGMELAEARTAKLRLMKILEQYNLKVFNLREKFEEHHDSEITVRGTVFPGVVMESHDRYYEVKQKRSRVIFYFDREQGRIQEKPLG
ncbi:MAG: FapA family protein, partial [Spirochaetaceae bacterium]|nr:FapA family protein [Spirochaetaceae bacterium]